MKKLHFYYRMFSGFSSMISDHSFTLQCVPESNDVQQIEIRKKQIAPVEWIARGKDSFGYSYLYGNTKEGHDSFCVEIEGTALVSRVGGYVFGDAEGGQKMYCFPTELTACSPEMRALASRYQKEYFDQEKNPAAFADVMYALMHEVFSIMEYCPGTTDTRTTAAEAYASKKGVCQDYAHIFIGLCRALGIPAVYVAGYMTGEGASHAWVAVFDSERGRWYEIDPTNDRWVDDGYISVSHGLDSADCIMNKGIFRGVAQENQEITVIVEEIE
ncbi:MAG: transglutaminase family protein [Eubacteriales bacterium]|nr:transglutaminase family protein [Eubacteriales bacterium]